MTRLNHPNVVVGINLPNELQQISSELPLMAMEYCKGGDLRRVS